MLREQPYTEKADCYAMGIVLWELLSCTLPFTGPEYGFLSQVEAAVTKGVRPDMPQYITRMLSTAPTSTEGREYEVRQMAARFVR